MHYNLSHLLPSDFPLVIDNLFWDTEDRQYILPGSKHINTDIFYVILDDIGSERGTLLDIGCNTALMDFMAVNRGHTVTTAVDKAIHQRKNNSSHPNPIDTAKSLIDIYGLSLELIEGNYLDIIPGHVWDYVIYLSAWDNLPSQNGDSNFYQKSLQEAENDFLNVWQATGKTLYFELNTNIRLLCKADDCQQDVPKKLLQLTGCEPIPVHVVKGEGGDPQTLWRLDKLNRPTITENIFLGASRKYNKGFRKGGILRMSREANDWQSHVHPSGLSIKRQAVVTKGEILKLLRDNPHPNLMKIIAFDDDWVDVEFIDGYLYDNEGPWLPSHLREDPSWLDIFGPKDLNVVKQIESAMAHLHSLGIAHTDLIPENILVRKDGVAKLIDLIGCMPLSPLYRKLDDTQLDFLRRYQKGFIQHSLRSCIRLMARCKRGLRRIFKAI